MNHSSILIQCSNSAVFPQKVHNVEWVWLYLRYGGDQHSSEGGACEMERYKSLHYYVNEVKQRSQHEQSSSDNGA